jgi:beta-lactam-binding protein with PASTA domain
MAVEIRIKQASRIVAALVAAAALVSLFLGLASGTPRAQVPHVTGDTKAAALERIERHHLRADVIRTERAARRLPSRYVGQVVHQNFRGGITLPEGSVVRLTVSPKGSAPRHARADR